MMFKIKFQNFRLRAKRIEILWPVEPDTLEYDIYAHGIRIGTTTNRVLNFSHILENAYELERVWKKKMDEVKQHAGTVAPMDELSQAQILIMIANKCPSPDQPLGNKTDPCWSSLDLNVVREWHAMPRYGKVTGDYVVAELK